MQSANFNSQYFVYPPLNQSCYPFYPYFNMNSSNLCFYGWNNDLPANAVPLIKAEPERDLPPNVQPLQQKPVAPKQQEQKTETKRSENKTRTTFKKKRTQQIKNSNEGLENRNIIPNIACNILSFVRRINRSGKITQMIVRKHKEESDLFGYSYKKFYSYQLYLKDNLTDHKGKDAIKVLISAADPQCTCFTINEQVFYNKVTRVLIAYYLQKNLFVDILSSNRVSKKNRDNYFKGKRILKNLISGKQEQQSDSLQKK